jgi:tetratricopeptide (TPR) repeat protein
MTKPCSWWLRIAAGVMAVLGVASQDAWGQPDRGPGLASLQARAKAHPERIDWAMELGDAAAEAGDYDLALRNFHHVLDIATPESEQAAQLHLKIGETYRRKGDIEAALAWLGKASRLMPEEPSAMGSLALTLDAAGRADEAVSAYRATLALDPDNLVTLNNLAFLLAERNQDLDFAGDLSQRALRLAPEDGDILDTAGWVEWKRKHTTTAASLFARAVGQDPSNAGYRQHLLQALGAEGSECGAPELKTLLGAEASPENLRRIAGMLKAVE